jgi:ankyrin repeat protein
LHIAAAHGNKEFISSIDSLANPNARKSMSPNVQDDTGRTPLHVAILNDQYHVVGALINIGVDPGIQDRDGLTAWHTAAGLGNEKAIRALNSYVKSSTGSTTNTASINQKDDSGRSPLQVCVQHGNAAVARALVANSEIDLLQQDTYGRTALQIAESRGDEAIVHLLRARIGFLPRGGANALAPSAIADVNEASIEFVTKFNTQDEWVEVGEYQVLLDLLIQF